MANGINVDPSRLQEGVDKLKQLQTQLSDAKGISEPSQVGGGNTVQKIIEIATLYSEIEDALDELLSNSVDYFTKVKESTVQTNQDTSAAILGSGGNTPLQNTTHVNNGGVSGLYSDTGSSKGNAEAAGLKYYAQMDSNTWKYGEDTCYLSEKGAVGCGASAMAMVSSYYYKDVDYYSPGYIMGKNGNVGINEKNANTIGLTIAGNEKDTVRNTETQANMRSILDQKLSNYQNGFAAPPVVGIDNGQEGKNHYVVVLGKNTDGSYIIADSNQKTGNWNGCTKLKLCIGTNELKRNTDDMSYTSYIKQIYTFEKK